MKIFFLNLIKHGLYTFISVLLVFSAIVIKEIWSEEGVYYPLTQKQEVIYGHDELKPYFIIQNSQIESEIEVLTISGAIENISDVYWSRLSVETKYFVDDIFMGQCFPGKSFTQFKPSTSRKFVIECPNLSPKLLPNGFSYKVYLDSGTRVIPDQ